MLDHSVQPGRRRCLVIDQGTHASRALVIEQSGRPLGSWSQDIGLHRIDRHHVEQDPAEILDSVQSVIRQALDSHQVDCVALATQRSTVLAWDHEQPLSAALSWQDTRAPEYLNALDSKRLTDITGLVASPHYAASKLRWLLDHVRGLGLKAGNQRQYLGPLASYLLWHLTGNCTQQPQVDHANAARTLLFNLQTRDWDPWLLEAFGLPNEMLPLCRPVRHTYGSLGSTGTPITCVCGDQTAALHAGGRPMPDTAYVNIGTGAFVLVHTGSSPKRHGGLLCGLCDSTDTHGSYCLEGTVNGAGAALTWAEEHWQIPDLSRQLHKWLGLVDEPPIFLNTVGGLGSPFWKAGPDPMLVGRDGQPLTIDVEPAAASVAVVESILFLLTANLAAINKAGCHLERIQVSGGLASMDSLCQRLADLTGIKVERPDQTEATAIGAAWLAFGCPDEWAPYDRVTVFEPRDNPSILRRYQLFLALIDRGG